MLLQVVTCLAMTSCWAGIAQAESGAVLDNSYFEDNGFSADDLDVPGVWTDWLNQDSDGIIGEFETIHDYLDKYNAREGRCMLWCQNPVAVKWRATWGPESNNNVATEDEAKELEKCVVLDASRFASAKFKGFECRNNEQMESTCSMDYCKEHNMYTPSYTREINCQQCPDFEVAYLCPHSASKPDTTKACPWDNTRSLQGKLRELKQKEKELAETRRDLAARESELEHDEATLRREQQPTADHQVQRSDKRELENILKMLLRRYN